MWIGHIFGPLGKHVRRDILLFSIELLSLHRASKTLGGISFGLFILGNVLLLHPSPSRHPTCYHAAPTLWWGVMTVTGVGWVLLLQVFLVMFIVGIGGHAVVVSPFAICLEASK